MKIYSATVKHVIYQQDEFMVFEAKLYGTKDTAVMVAQGNELPKKGRQYNFEGVRFKHKTYGTQFKVSSFAESRPQATAVERRAFRESAQIAKHI